MSKVVAVDLGCVAAANAALWGRRPIWPAIGPLLCLLKTDPQAPVLLAALIHRSVLQRSVALVESLRICAQGNKLTTASVVAVAPLLKADRAERGELARDGDPGGVPLDVEVIVRAVDAPATRQHG